MRYEGIEQVSDSGLQYNSIASRLFYDPFISLSNKYFCRCYSLEDDFRTLDLLTEAREQNKCLRLQVETLRQKLADAEGDIKVLRTNNNRIPIEQQETQLAPAMHQREEMIEQLEKLNLKVSLKRKIQCHRYISEIKVVHNSFSSLLIYVHYWL